MLSVCPNPQLCFLFCLLSPTFRHKTHIVYTIPRPPNVLPGRSSFVLSWHAPYKYKHSASLLFSTLFPMSLFQTTRFDAFCSSSSFCVRSLVAFLSVVIYATHVTDDKGGPLAHASRPYYENVACTSYTIWKSTTCTNYIIRPIHQTALVVNWQLHVPCMEFCRTDARRRIEVATPPVPARLRQPCFSNFRNQGTARWGEQNSSSKGSVHGASLQGPQSYGIFDVTVSWTSIPHFVWFKYVHT